MAEGEGRQRDRGGDCPGHDGSAALVGLSVLSGSHLAAVPAVLDGLRARGLGEVPVVVGGIIPPDDAAKLRTAGVARVFTPKDFALTEIVDELVTVVRKANGLDT